jgi:hypothetical protein
LDGRQTLGRFVIRMFLGASFWQGAQLAARGCVAGPGCVGG